jgi:uncharacterized protein (DUF2237 family)
MRLLLSAAIVAALFATPAFAASGDNMKACAASWKNMAPADKAKTTYRDYSKVCLANGPTTAPSANTIAVRQHPMTPQERMKDCAARWDAMKKAGTTGSQTYRQYSTSCLRKM